MNARPYLTSVRHVRGGPVVNDFRYPGVAWLVDVSEDEPGPRWLRPIVGFRASDHLGDPRKSWRHNVVAFAAAQGVTVGQGPIRAMTGARTTGYAFDPITIYWCYEASGAVQCVIAEVRNTYGDRHVYLVHPEDGAARTDKAMYVSPFNDTSGQYRMSVPAPAPDLDVRITLHRQGQRPFVTAWSGRPVQGWRDRTLLVLRAPLAAQWVTARIHWQGVKLWLRRLPIVPRPHHRPQEAV